MKNVTMSHSEFVKFKEYLRKTDITWRDLSTSVMVPAWGECICDNDYMIGDFSCAQYAHILLQKEFPGLSLRWRQTELELLGAKTPFFFDGEYTGPVYHIDIVGAYSQFYRFLYFHSEWPYKRQKHSLFGIASHFAGKTEPQYKIARNSIVGIARSQQNKWVKGSSVWYTKKVNKFLSPTLWAQLQGILTQIAYQMIDFGAIWVNTDGYCFRDRFGYDTALDYFDHNDIKVRGTTGEGVINGIASMNVPGVKVTGENNPTKPMVRLDPLSEVNHLAELAKNKRRNREDTEQ